MSWLFGCAIWPLWSGMVMKGETGPGGRTDIVDMFSLFLGMQFMFIAFFAFWGHRSFLECPPVLGKEANLSISRAMQWEIMIQSQNRYAWYPWTSCLVHNLGDVKKVELYLLCNIWRLWTLLTSLLEGFGERQDLVLLNLAHFSLLPVDDFCRHREIHETLYTYSV